MKMPAFLLTALLAAMSRSASIATRPEEVVALDLTSPVFRKVKFTRR
jgi:hypothetical protein